MGLGSVTLDGPLRLRSDEYGPIAAYCDPLRGSLRVADVLHPQHYHHVLSFLEVYKKKATSFLL